MPAHDRRMHADHALRPCRRQDGQEQREPNATCKRNGDRRTECPCAQNHRRQADQQAAAQPQHDHPRSDAHAIAIVDRRISLAAQHRAKADNQRRRRVAKPLHRRSHRRSARLCLLSCTIRRRVYRTHPCPLIRTPSCHAGKRIWPKSRPRSPDFACAFLPYASAGKPARLRAAALTARRYQCGSASSGYMPNNRLPPRESAKISLISVDLRPISGDSSGNRNAPLACAAA